MDLSYDDDWYRYIGDSTVYHMCKSGISVHLPDPGESGEADRIEDSPEGSDPNRLGPDHDKDSNREEG